MKTNREKNLAHDAKMQDKIRPKKEWNWEPLAEVIRQWKAGANE